jgi:PTH1 family peptidyl-tRNA hydrolase
MFLIAGLGNVGDEYKNNRHNVGFMVIDKIITNLAVVTINKSIFKSQLFRFANIFFVKPQTFMNESGQSLASITEYYNISNDNIIVIHDDLDLPFGTIKFKKNGGSGGHNGIKSIDNYIGKDYIRIRIGIGRPSCKEQISNYVLSDFSKEEFLRLDDIIQHIIKSIDGYLIDSYEERLKLWNISIEIISFSY